MSLPFLPHPILFFCPLAGACLANFCVFFLLRSDVGKEGRRERRNSAQFSLALMERARPCHAAKAKKASGKLPPPPFFLPARSITQINLLIGWLQQKRNWNEKKDSGNFSRVSQAEKFVFPAILSYRGERVVRWTKITRLSFVPVPNFANLSTLRKINNRDIARSHTGAQQSFLLSLFVSI